MAIKTGTKPLRHKKSFLDLFPPPKFLEMPAPGLALDESALRFVEFARTQTDVVIKDFGKELLPEGLISAGEIVNQVGLVSFLKAFTDKHGFRHIRASLPEEKSYLFRGRIPKVASPAEIRTAVEFIIEENVPISVSEAVFDFTIIENVENQNGDTIDVSVTVVPKDIVESYLNTFNSADLFPLHFEVESQAVAKAVIEREDKSPCLIIHLFDKKVGLYIFGDGAVQFSSTLPINKQTKTDDKNPSIGKLSISDLPFNAIREESQKIMSYWDSQLDKMGLGRKVIETIILSGAGADEETLTHELSPLGLKIQMANVWINVLSLDVHIPSIHRRDSFEYATAIGLALPHRIGVK